MYCPNCGKPDQTPDAFCRQCGHYLPDFEKLKKKETTPEEHLKANSFLNLLTAVVSLALAVTLYVIFLGRSDTHWIIYLTAGFLTAICAWQVQTFWRTQLLKKHFRRQRELRNAPAQTNSEPLLAVPTKELLPGADLRDVVPASVTENTTRDLKVKMNS